MDEEYVYTSRHFDKDVQMCFNTVNWEVSKRITKVECGRGLVWTSGECMYFSINVLSWHALTVPGWVARLSLRSLGAPSTPQMTQVVTAPTARKVTSHLRM